jgi:predicted CXXCH cytochrome family protein
MTRGNRAAAVAGVLAILGVGVGVAFRARQPASVPSDGAARPVTPQAATYVENGACLGCHREEGRQWAESHHAMAMALPTEASVRGDFNGTTFTHRGVTTRFFRRDSKYFVNTEGPDGKFADFEVRYTFGLEPLQQYLLATPGGRLQPLSVAWDGPKRRWFHLLPDEKTPPGDVLHWTGRYQTANTMCLVCHTTNFEKRYDAKADTFASTWSEPNVSCQSCHGPGSAHVEWETSQRGGGERKQAAPATPHALTVDFRASGSRAAIDVCAPCHSRRSELATAPAPHEAVLDAYLPSLLVPPLYHDDGQQLDEVYVDASFRQSRMFQKGVVCTNCHNAHTGKLKLAGNAVCLQCHRKDPGSGFPTAAGDYDSPAHHFHKANSTGASCVACHMPPKTYMQIQRRPDHSIRVPRPDLAVKLGTPDACTNCHTDRKPEWAAAAVAKWYGPKRRQERHYGEAFRAARAGEPGGAEALSLVAADPGMPAIVRASALADLRQDPVTGAAARMSAAKDNDALIRLGAAESAEGLPVDERLATLTPLLRDPLRAVRVTAARNLSSVAAERLSGDAKTAFDTALAEYITAQETALDMPGAQFNLAVVYENTARRDLAETYYRGALRIDPDFTAARANLAVLLSGLARNADAEQVLVEGLKRRPDLGDLQYSLGLILAEGNRMAEAKAALAKAARLLPARADVQYNYGLALQQTGESAAAEKSLLRAQQIDPSDPAIPYALAILYAQTNRIPKALEWADRLQSMRPGDPQIARLIASLRSKR